MATAIFFNGRRINVPQVTSKIDASALSTISPSAVGIVALVGTAEGGVPLTVDETFSDMSRSGQVYTRYRTGDLKTASLFAFEPSSDEAVPNGAQKIVAVKVNPATQSVGVLQDDFAANAVDLTSRDYGLFTEQINITVATGTNQGKQITIVFEDESEVFDDVGGDAAFTVGYTAGSDGYDTITGQITATQFIAAATKDELGRVTERTADIPAPGVLDVASDNVADTTQTITVYGLDASNVPIKESIALNGTTNVTGSVSFTKVLGCVLDAAGAGTVTVSDSPISASLFVLAAAVLTRGVTLTTATPVNGVVTVTIDTDDATDCVIRGANASGVEVAERIDLAAANTTPVVGTVVFARITQIELGDTAAARTVSISCNAEAVGHSTYNTVSKLVDRLNTLDGFTAAALVSNPTTFAMTDMDYEAAVNLLAVTANFTADLYAVIKKINTESAYVSAARATSATSVPANTVVPAFLTGGVEGVTTIAEWQAAFELLRRRRVTTIVPLTRDPAVHNLLLSHLVERAGRLRSEANGYVGIGNTDGAGEARATIKSEIQVLQSRHISAISEECQRFDPETGDATWYPPYIYASIAAGMQAGSPIGEPLTRKRPAVTDVRNDSSWSVENDVEELIDAGLMMSEKVDNVGIRWIRSITTHLADDNVVFTEVSANEAANTAVFELRRQLELKIGQRGLAGSAAAIKGLANDVLGRLIDDEIIVAYKALQVDQIGDVFPVSVEIAPVLPINFIPITVHLVAVRAAA
jgi:hypothetical protein